MLNELLKKYYVKKEEESKLKRSLELRGKIMDALGECGSFHTRNFKAELVEHTRSYFNLKEAKSQLNESILKPFIKESIVKSVKVKPKIDIVIKKAA